MIENTKKDAFTFYACAITSFLESTVATFVDNLEPFFEADHDTKQWLKKTWQPEEAEHGELMRDYVMKQWPNFDWQAAYQEFFALYKPQFAHEKLRQTDSLEALSRCVTETEATMIYRCIGNYTQDATLRSLMTKLSRDEIRHYKYFRTLHHQLEKSSPTSFIKRLCTMVKRSELVKNEDLLMAFHPLNKHWKKAKPFSAWTYEEFLMQASQVMKQHFPLEEAKRMMLKPLQQNHWHESVTLPILAWVMRQQFMSRV